MSILDNYNSKSISEQFHPHCKVETIIKGNLTFDYYDININSSTPDNPDFCTVVIKYKKDTIIEEFITPENLNFIASKKVLREYIDRKVYEFRLLFSERPSISDYYYSSVISVTHSISKFITYLELGINIDWNDWEDNFDIEVKTHFYENYKGRGTLEVFSVWYQNEPVMLIREAGKECRYYEDLWITSLNGYKNLVKYILDKWSSKINDIKIVKESCRDVRLIELYGKVFTKTSLKTLDKVLK